MRKTRKSAYQCRVNGRQRIVRVPYQAGSQWHMSSTEDAWMRDNALCVLIEKHSTFNQEWDKAANNLRMNGHRGPIPAHIEL